MKRENLIKEKVEFDRLIEKAMLFLEEIDPNIKFSCNVIPNYSLVNYLSSWSVAKLNRLIIYIDKVAIECETDIQKCSLQIALKSIFDLVNEKNSFLEFDEKANFPTIRYRK